MSATGDEVVTLSQLKEFCNPLPIECGGTGANSAKDIIKSLGIDDYINEMINISRTTFSGSVIFNASSYQAQYIVSDFTITASQSCPELSTDGSKILFSQPGTYRVSGSLIFNYSKNNRSNMPRDITLYFGLSTNGTPIYQFVPNSNGGYIDTTFSINMNISSVSNNYFTLYGRQNSSPYDSIAISKLSIPIFSITRVS